MEQLPIWLPALFIITTATAAFLFLKATRFNKTVLAIILIWSLLQAAVTLTGFYQITSGNPPRFGLLTFPPLLATILLFLTRKGRSFLDKLDAKMLTLLHTIRVLVEIVLYGLFLHHAVPLIMTFEGRNFDILSGLSAPVMWYVYYYKAWISKWWLLAWNIACPVLLGNIIVTAVLCAPFPFQQYGFEQPNVALLYFPFSWLPALVVPLVLLSHLTVIRQLLINKSK